MVATNEAFFPTRDDYDAHDALMAVAHNAIVSDDSRFRLTPDHYLKSRADMAKLFADLPEALENTVEIAHRCSFVLNTRKPILPRFTGGSADPEEAERAEARELRDQAVEGLNQRLATLGMAAGYEEQEYRDRLEFELSVIERMKFPGYFLIVADFIKWAKQQDIPVGPGRGSGAGSLVAYALTITDVDPLALLAAVRALPQSGTRLDARLRHRLLPGSPRGGDPLRPEEIWPRAGGADHHLRFAAGARRTARRRPRAGNALWPGRQDLQAGAEQSGQSDAAL